MKRLAILVTTLLVMAGYASAQDLYKCKAPDGRTIISNAPCVQGSNETVIPSAVSPPVSPTSVTEERASRPPVTSSPTGDAAFKALRKIMAATEVGVNMRDYGQLVIEAKAAVSDSTLKGKAQQELESAVSAYADGLTVYNLVLEDSRSGRGQEFFVGEHHPEANRLNAKYGFTKRSSDLVDRKVALSAIWTVAKNHVLRATDLVK